MGQIIFGAVTPHPPIIIEQVGGDERLKAEGTIQGLEKLAADIVALCPDTLIIISPHGPVFEDGIVVLGKSQLMGDFANFGAAEVKLSFSNDRDLADRIVDKAKERGIFALVADEEESRRLGVKQVLDHGAAVPLTFLKHAGFAGKIVLMGMALFPPDMLYEFGMAIQQAINESGKRVGIIASGDLSHRLTYHAPAGFNPKGEEFDRLLVDKFSLGDFAGIMDIDPGLAEAAGECGYRPVNILLGAFDSYQVQTEVYNYQGPFGVGYLVAGIIPLEKSGESSRHITDYRARREQRQAEINANRHPIVRLAAQSLEHYLQQGDYLKEFTPLPEGLPARAGAFVSLKKHGNLRGCIGTIEATKQDLAQEVIKNAVSAGTEDPRFFPVELEELSELTISVDVLGEPEEIASEELLDPQKYGVIVQKGNRSGLLLPNLEGIDSVEEQVRIAKEKAGIGLNESVELRRFEVIRFN